MEYVFPQKYKYMGQQYFRPSTHSSILVIWFGIRSKPPTQVQPSSPCSINSQLSPFNSSNVGSVEGRTPIKHAWLNRQPLALFYSKQVSELLFFALKLRIIDYSWPVKNMWWVVYTSFDRLTCFYNCRIIYEYRNIQWGSQDINTWYRRSKK